MYDREGAAIEHAGNGRQPRRRDQPASEVPATKQTTAYRQTIRRFFQLQPRDNSATPNNSGAEPTAGVECFDMQYRATVGLDTGKNEGSQGKVFVKASLNGYVLEQDENGQDAEVVTSTRNFALTGIPGAGDGKLPESEAIRAFGLAMVRFADRLDAGKVMPISATGPVPVTSKNGKVAGGAPAAPTLTLPTI